jgi:hypothetical protein
MHIRVFRKKAGAGRVAGVGTQQSHSKKKYFFGTNIKRDAATSVADPDPYVLGPQDRIRIG